MSGGGRAREPGSGRFDRSARAAFVVAAVTLALSGLGFRSAVELLNVHLHKEPVPLRGHLAGIPRVLGPWQSVGEDLTLDAAQIEELGTDRYLNRVYALDGSPAEGRIAVHVAYYTGLIDAVPHIPDRCFQGAGWERRSMPANHDLLVQFPGARVDPGPPGRDTGEPYRLVDAVHPVTLRRETARLPFGTLQLRTSAFSLPQRDDYLHWAGFLFIANHHATVSPAFIRSMAFRPSQRYAYYAKIQLEMTLRKDEGPDRFLAAASDLLQHLLPHLMLCLPDWAEVESGATGSSAPDSTETQASGLPLRGSSWHPA